MASRKHSQHLLAGFRSRVRVPVKALTNEDTSCYEQRILPQTAPTVRTESQTRGHSVQTTAATKRLLVAPRCGAARTHTTAQTSSSADERTCFRQVGWPWCSMVTMSNSYGAAVGSSSRRRQDNRRQAQHERLPPILTHLPAAGRALRPPPLLAISLDSPTLTRRFPHGSR